MLFLIAEILSRGIYTIKFSDECNIDSQIARQMIRDVMSAELNIDTFSYTKDGAFIMIIDILARQRGPVEREQLEAILKNYCSYFSIDFKEGLP